MKRTIAIVCGGDTSEFEVSLRSAYESTPSSTREIHIIYCGDARDRLARAAFDGTKTPVDRNDFSFRLDDCEGSIRLRLYHLSTALRGRRTPVGYFDMLHIPYSCWGYLPLH